jgi:hypothetical protein
MIEHEINKLDYFIMGWYAENTQFCDQLIEIHKKSEYTTDGSQGMEYKIDKGIKESKDSAFYQDSLGWLNYGPVLKNCLDLYTNKFEASAGLNGYTMKEMFNVQYYPPGGGYKMFHNERPCADLPVGQRHLVFMTYLNDINDEGGTEFLYQKLKLKPKKGLTLIWPADWTHTHKSIVSNTEEKWVVTGWLHQKTSQE